MCCCYIEPRGSDVQAHGKKEGLAMTAAKQIENENRDEATPDHDAPEHNPGQAAHHNKGGKHEEGKVHATTGQGKGEQTFQRKVATHEHLHR